MGERQTMKEIETIETIYETGKKNYGPNLIDISEDYSIYYNILVYLLFLNID